MCFARRHWVLLFMGLISSSGLVPALNVSFVFGAGQETTKATGLSGGDAAAGKAIYERHCHYCHGQKGYGDGPVGTAITPHPADFVHDSKRMRKSDEKLFKSISEGVQRKIGGEAMAMPRWAHILSKKDISDVLAYVRELERQGRLKEGLAPNVRDVNDDVKKRKNGKISR